MSGVEFLLVVVIESRDWGVRVLGRNSSRSTERITCDAKSSHTRTDSLQPD